MKMKKKSLLAVLLVLGMMGSVCACGTEAEPTSTPQGGTESTTAGGTSEGTAASGTLDESKPIYLAATMPLTGEDVYQWEVQKKVMLMAVDEINAAGGVLGRKVILDCYDDAGDPQQGVTVIQGIVDDSKYAGLLGPAYSGVTLAALPITMEAHIPQVTNASNSQITEQGATNIFINSINDSLMGPVAAMYLHDTLGAKSVAIVHNKTTWGQGVTEKFKAKAEELGMTVTSFQGVDTDSADYSAILTKIKNENPDAIYTGMAVEAGRFRKQMVSLGMTDMIFIGAELDGAEIMDQAGADLVGAYTISSAPDRNEKTMNDTTRAFTERCQADFGLNPEPWSFYAYDSVFVIADAIERAGSTEKEAVIAALRETEMDGICMEEFHWSFDEKGRLAEPITFVWQCTAAGEFSQIEKISAKYE